MLKNARIFVLLCAVVAWALGVTSGCAPSQPIKTVSLESGSSVTPTSEPGPGTLRIAVGGMITPKAGLAYYKQLVDYIGAKLGRPVQFIDRPSYAEVNMLVQTRQADLAFVCSGPYVTGHADFGMELIAAPMVHGVAAYHSYIIVPKDSSAKTLKDLRGRVFAFTDPDSNTGKLVPTYMLAKMGQTPESFFDHYVYTKGHDNTIRAVARHLVDGAAVDSLIYDYQKATDPTYTSQTRIIWQSPAYAIPPVVVNPNVDPKLKEQFRNVLLQANEDPEGKRILAGMLVDRFVVISDGAYASVREMNDWVAAHKPKTAK
jgi:phosphonate transport system substrate-binding protein